MKLELIEFFHSYQRDTLWIWSDLKCLFVHRYNGFNPLHVILSIKQEKKNCSAVINVLPKKIYIYIKYHVLKKLY